MKKAKYYKNLFLIAGLWNFAVALPCWLGAIFMPDFAFGLFDLTPPDSLFTVHAMLGFVITYGIGYIIVSHDISKNHGIIFVGGILGKVIVFIDCIITLLLKEGNLFLVLVGTVDLIFACLFIEFFHTVRKGQVQPLT